MRKQTRRSFLKLAAGGAAATASLGDVAHALSLSDIMSLHKTDANSFLARNSENPLIATRTIRFTTDEGTYISPALSPDDRRIVFDLLGDIYILPVTGGRALRITSGLNYDSQPRFSPDGKTIVFVSDRNGMSNLWLMGADGKNLRPLTDVKYGTFTSPSWMADGKGILVSQIIYGRASERSDYSIYYYPLNGGKPVNLVEAPRDNRGYPVKALGPVISSDARFVYFAKGVSGTGAFQIERYDREKRQLKLLRRRRAEGFDQL